MGPYVLGLRETSRKITSPSILFPLRCILFPSVYLQLWFCSVISTCIFEAILWSHPSHRAETELLWNFGVSTCSICKVILKFSSVTLRLQCPCWKPTIYHRFVDILSRYDLFWWLVPEKIAFCLQHSGTKYRYFIWAKRSTAYCAAMVHSARCIALLLAPFDFTLPSEREKPSRKIEISPHTRWVLLYQSLSIPSAHVSFSSEPSRNLLCATILDIMSTSYAYVLLLRRARSLPRHAARDRARAAAGPTTFWRRVSQWVSLRAAGWSF